MLKYISIIIHHNWLLLKVYHITPGRITIVKLEYEHNQRFEKNFKMINK